MKPEHYKILQFLSKQRDWVHIDDFPDAVISGFTKYGDSKGILIHELQIDLTNKEWIEPNSHAGNKYKISANGIAALREEELKMRHAQYVYERQFKTHGNEINDLPAENWYRRPAVIWTIVGILAAIIAVLLMLCRIKKI
jgi:hypothetical protein